MQNIEQKQLVKMQDNFLSAFALAEENEDLLSVISAKIEETGAMMDESDLWALVATSRSPQWQDAKSNLDECRLDLEDRLSDDNIPLGPIGLAFDAGALDNSRDAFTMALSQYTIIDEELRQRRDLQRTFSQLTMLQKQLKSSYDLSRKALKQTQKLDQSMKLSALKPLTSSFQAAKAFRTLMATPAEQLLESAKRKMFRKAAQRLQPVAEQTPKPKRRRRLEAFAMHGFE